MSLRLTQIDDLTRGDHYYLEAADECYCLGEYTARGGFACSATNQLVLNLKKSPDRRNRPEWHYKSLAIEQVAREFRDSIDSNWLAGGGTFVPVPPSKAKDDPLYDDRMLQVLRAMMNGVNGDIRELVLQKKSIAAAHESDDRPTQAQLANNYKIVKRLRRPAPHAIVIVDDVLTTGAHFKAMQMVLAEHFPAARIIGLFVARRLPQSDFFEP